MSWCEAKLPHEEAHPILQNEPLHRADSKGREKQGWETAHENAFGHASHLRCGRGCLTGYRTITNTVSPLSSSGYAAPLAAEQGQKSARIPLQEG
ncbi:hypothetical protein AS9A_P20045 (plasmid) [Hoyosella subflava DQS3-9A1]|uniref:Uncharacterized protein n=1 Tax=Hoyosella subflava (strain DSM 45089 / JCM 17490 / NBRC 109087 / DQS3-9A1) TaxID=443218 RepID=F6ESG8_HOYSD|nr:hypothetical protein AS9A_P20045 [Hoyosella subflava DQS3-9A1]